MAKTTTGSLDRIGAPTRADDEWEEFAIAGSLKDGEAIHGIYLGYETAMLPNGPCKRHHFTLACGARRVILGAALLDSQLGGMTLGRETHVERLIERLGRAVVYRARQRGPVVIDEALTIGRSIEIA